MNQTKKIHFNSEQYQLEAVLEYPANFDLDIEIEEFAIICHPHPIHGGTMNNKVVYSLVKACIEKHLPTLRFNFRGVGESEGTFGKLAGEMIDLKSAINYAIENFSIKKIRLGGFSFGSYVALKTYSEMAESLEKKGYELTKPLIIAPPVAVEGYDFESLNPNQAVVVIGKEDQIVAESKVRDWVFTRKGAIDYLSIAQCEHFFHRKTVLLRNALIALI